jgi:hypothetical protein
VIEVAEFTVKVVAGVDPKLTAEAPVRLVPVMVTGVPPAVDPELGLTEVTAGVEVPPPPPPPPGAEALSSAAALADVPAGDWVALGVRVLETLGS